MEAGGVGGKGAGNRMEGQDATPDPADRRALLRRGLHYKLWDRHGFGRAQLHAVPPQDNEAAAAVTATITAPTCMNPFTFENFLGIRT